MTTQTPRSTAHVVDSDTEGVPSFEASGGGTVAPWYSTSMPPSG